MRLRRSEGRFRQRLTTAFVLVAATAGGLLALSSFLLIREYRLRTFQERAVEKAALSLIAAPEDLSVGGAEALVAEYRERGGFETVVVSGDIMFSSLPSLDRNDVPADLLAGTSPGELRSATAPVDGAPTLVIGGATPTGAVQAYFFFPRSDLLESIDNFRDVLLIGWLGTMAAAALLGRVVARRTLRPMREAATASEALAERLLNTHLEPASEDELGRWAASFNTMASALQDKLDALAEAAARERRLTADVAHELRTPLTGMVSAASLLEDNVAAMDPEAAAAAQLLVDDVKRLHGLVIELLELARFDAGQERADLEPLSVRQSLAAVARTWGGGAAVRVDAPGELFMLADRARFKRVVANLVGNATEHGGDTVEIEAHREGSRVVITVSDRGPGIDVDHLDRVFDRFYKGDPARSAAGSGLGLAIALENARLQGGSITARNRDGGGATFRFDVAAVAPPPGVGGDEPGAVGGARNHKDPAPAP